MYWYESVFCYTHIIYRLICLSLILINNLSINQLLSVRFHWGVQYSPSLLLLLVYWCNHWTDVSLSHSNHQRRCAVSKSIQSRPEQNTENFKLICAHSVGEDVWSFLRTLGSASQAQIVSFVLLLIQEMIILLTICAPKLLPFQQIKNFLLVFPVVRQNVTPGVDF